MATDLVIPDDVRQVQNEWARRGRFVTLAEGHRIFALQEGSGPDIVLVHGFPSTSHDFSAVLPLLTRGHRVTTFDHLGFGFSDKPAGQTSYSLLDQGRRAGEIVRALGIERARVVGHDMGLTVAVEMLCRQEVGTLGFTIEELVLANGSHLVELAHITPFQRTIMTDDGAEVFAATYDPEAFAAAFRFLWADPARTPAVDIRAIAYWLAQGDGLAILPRIARYNLERTWYAERWRPILGRTTVPIRVVWGDQDPIAVFEIGKRLAELSGSPLRVLEGVGHYAQMEAPAAWVAAVNEVAPPGVRDTAATIARLRAEESALPPEERLFEDPFAYLFAGGAAAEEVTKLFVAVPFFREQVRLRTRFIDDTVRTALAEGLRQIVILGAGFDCRALRLHEIAVAGARVFEVDFKGQLAAKRGRLTDAGVTIPEWVHYVGCDFDQPDFEVRLMKDITAAGFRAGAGALFLWEGVTSYLDDDAIDTTLRFMARAGGPATRVVFNYQLNRLLPEAVARRVAAAGFAALDDETLAATHRRYLGREAPPAAELFRIAVARTSAA